MILFMIKLRLPQTSKKPIYQKSERVLNFDFIKKCNFFIKSLAQKNKSLTIMNVGGRCKAGDHVEARTLHIAFFIL